MNRVNYIKIITSALLVASLFAPIILKSSPLHTERRTKTIDFNNAPSNTSKSDIQLLCEEKEKEEEFGVSTFQSAILVSGLIIDFSSLIVSSTVTFGVVNSRPLVRTIPLYLVKQSLII